MDFIILRGQKLKIKTIAYKIIQYLAPILIVFCLLFSLQCQYSPLIIQLIIIFCLELRWILCSHLLEFCTTRPEMCTVDWWAPTNWKGLYC